MNEPRTSERGWPDQTVFTRVIGVVAIEADRASTRRQRKRLKRIASDLAVISNAISVAAREERKRV